MLFSRLLEMVYKDAYAYRRAFYGPLRCAKMFRVEKYFSRYIACETHVFICERYRFIYYPIPKVASKTLRAMFLEAIGHTPPPPPLIEIDMYAQLQSMKTPRPEAQTTPFDDYFKFAFVRNPWARLVSCYWNKISDVRYAYDKTGRDRAGIFQDYAGHIHAQMSFADFVRFVCRVPDDLCNRHFKPQSAFFNAGEVNFVGRMEHFSEDLTRIIEQVGLGESYFKWCTSKVNCAAGPHEAESREQHYTDFYNAETRRLVAEKYRDDIERFGYRFEG